MFPFFVININMSTISTIQTDNTNTQEVPVENNSALEKNDKINEYYTYYDDRYDFKDLRKRGDAQLSDFIFYNRFNDEQAKNIRKAYSEIMSGIGKGDITYADGRFYDSTGTIKNGMYQDKDGNIKYSKSPSKDYYGMAARFIAELYQNGKKYVDPNDKNKIKTENGKGLSSALTKQIFGETDSPNVNYFYDLDELDTNTNKRGVTGRLDKLKTGITYIKNNFNNLFSVDENDQNDYQSLLQSVINKINDNILNSGDLYELRKVFPEIDFEEWLKTDFSQPEKEVEKEDEQVTLTEEQLQAQQAAKQKADLDKKIADWVRTKYNYTWGQDVPLTRRTFNIDYAKKPITDKITSKLETLDKDQLLDIIKLSLYRKGYNFQNDSRIRSLFKNDTNYFKYPITNELGTYLALQVLKSKGWLDDMGDGRFYIPKTRIQGRYKALVYNPDNNTISEELLHNIPYWNKKMYNDFINENNTWSDVFTKYVSSNKEGGVLKCGDGKSIFDVNLFSGGKQGIGNMIVSGVQELGNIFGGSARASESIKTNNQISEILTQAEKPVLTEAVKKQAAPVTGAFDYMQFTNRQAANTRRDADRPFTSDANTQLSAKLQANSQAQGIEQKGFLEDDNAIKQNKAQALQIQNENTAAEIQNANAIKQSIQNAEKNKAQIEAIRLKQNWQSKDNLAGELLNRFNTRMEERQQHMLNTETQMLDELYQSELDKYNAARSRWIADNQGKDFSTSGDPYNQYNKNIRNLMNWRTREGNRLYGNIKGFFGFKNGGILRPSTQYLINKVIKNENYT